MTPVDLKALRELSDQVEDVPANGWTYADVCKWMDRRDALLSKLGRHRRALLARAEAFERIRKALRGWHSADWSDISRIVHEVEAKERQG